MIRYKGSNVDGYLQNFLHFNLKLIADDIEEDNILDFLSENFFFREFILRDHRIHEHHGPDHKRNVEKTFRKFVYDFLFHETRKDFFQLKG